MGQKKRLLPSELLLKYCLQGNVEKSIEIITENPRILRGQKNAEKQTIAHILVSENNQVSYTITEFSLFCIGELRVEADLLLISK